MSFSRRVYIVEASGKVRRVPARVSDALPFGQDAIPEYAGARQKVAEIVVENEGGKPIGIRRVSGSYWSFDDRGRIDYDLRRSAWDAISTYVERPTTNSDVLDIGPELKRKRWEEQNRWDVTPEILSIITADLWPGLPTVADVDLVKGRAPERPPLPSEARSVLREIKSKLGSMTWEIDKLSEPALKGLAFEMRQMAVVESGAASIWLGFAAHADRAREIKRRRRSGKGIWYAVLHVWDRDPDRSMTEVRTFEERCEGKKAAIVAAREMLRKHADKFDDQFSINAEVLSELEWQPDADQN